MLKAHETMTTGSRPTVSIRIVRADGGREAVVPMRGDVLVCGKQGDVALPDDPFVAVTQARFSFNQGQLLVEDVGGGNGVFQRLRQDKTIQAGVELRMGRQRLIVEPISPLSPAAGGTTLWGSPDPGYRFRLIQVFEGGMRGSAFPLKAGENMVGREAGDITFPTDGFVSGKHAMLEVKEDRLLIRDMGSSNGTFVRLTSPTPVENGDQFLVGRQLLKLELA